MKLITDLEKKFKVDHKRIYLVGYSNGAFMANKFACDHSPLIAAVVSVAGAGNIDFGQCQAQPPVSFLHIHGTNDEIVKFEGGEFLGVKYPGAIETVN